MFAINSDPMVLVLGTFQGDFITRVIPVEAFFLVNKPLLIEGDPKGYGEDDLINSNDDGGDDSNGNGKLREEVKLPEPSLSINDGDGGKDCKETPIINLHISKGKHLYIFCRP